MADVQEQDKNHARHALAWINHGINHGLITAAGLNALTTVAAWIAVINAVTNVSEQNENIRRELVKMLATAKNVGALLDADINTIGAAAEGTRLAAVRALFTTIDTTLDAAHARSFAF